MGTGISSSDESSWNWLCGFWAAERAAWLVLLVIVERGRLSCLWEVRLMGRVPIGVGEAVAIAVMCM